MATKQKRKNQIRVLPSAGLLRGRSRRIRPIAATPERMKIGTALDEKLFRELKEFSARQGRPLNEIIEEALEKYLRAGSLTREMRIASANKFCSLGFHASVKEIQQLMEEDYYDQ